MRTTVDIPADLLLEVERATEAPTRKQALILALSEFVRYRRLQRVLEAAGTLEFDMEPRAIRDLDRRRWK